MLAFLALLDAIKAHAPALSSMASTMNSSLVCTASAKAVIASLAAATVGVVAASVSSSPPYESEERESDEDDRDAGTSLWRRGGSSPVALAARAVCGVSALGSMPADSAVT